MQLKSEQLWSILDGVGFGRTTGSGFPGESSGLMSDYTSWREIEQAILAYGYGLSVTPLQLAEAYSVLAADGVYHPASFVMVGDVAPTRVMRKETARAVRSLLTGVVDPEGTGYQASISGYTVAGKTGTAKKSVAGGYSEDRYIAVFAGMAPASNPELVTVVMINEPSGEEYSGGQVAAPVFSKVMAGALRYLDVTPDDYTQIKSASGRREDQRV
jgi:cell division protein FtsI (penicillin-binding protein 3)